MSLAGLYREEGCIIHITTNIHVSLVVTQTCLVQSTTRITGMWLYSGDIPKFLDILRPPSVALVPCRTFKIVIFPPYLIFMKKLEITYILSCLAMWQNFEYKVSCYCSPNGRYEVVYANGGFMQWWLSQSSIRNLKKKKIIRGHTCGRDQLFPNHCQCFWYNNYLTYTILDSTSS